MPELEERPTSEEPENEELDTPEASDTEDSTEAVESEMADDEPVAAESSDDAAPVMQVSVPEISDSDDSSALREMVEYIARALTSMPEAVKVSEEEDGNRTVFHLSVDDKDKGKVIGRDGRVAQSIRSLLRVAATKQGTRIMLEID